LEDNDAWFLSASGSPPCFFDFLTNQTLTKHETSSNPPTRPVPSLPLSPPQSTVPIGPKGINALSMACDQGADVVSNAGRARDWRKRNRPFYRKGHTVIWQNAPNVLQLNAFGQPNFQLPKF
jgi:hypothetical protein